MQPAQSALVKPLHLFSRKSFWQTARVSGHDHVPNIAQRLSKHAAALFGLLQQFENLIHLNRPTFASDAKLNGSLLLKTPTPFGISSSVGKL